MLSGAGIAAGLDATHGLDHGAWAPLLSLFPGAGLPVIQLSVQPERCARHHFALGRALAALPDESILVVALGRMAHHHNDHLHRITSYNVCYTKLLRNACSFPVARFGIGHSRR